MTLRKKQLIIIKNNPQHHDFKLEYVSKIDNDLLVRKATSSPAKDFTEATRKHVSADLKASPHHPKRTIVMHGVLFTYNFEK